MFNVQIVLYSGYSVFGSYCKLVSKDGKFLVRQANSENPLTHYMICQTNRLIFKKAYKLESSQPHVQVEFLEQMSPTEFKEHEITLPSQMGGKNLLAYIDSHPDGIAVWSENYEQSKLYPTFFEALVAIAAQFESTLNQKQIDDLAKLLNLEVLYVGKTKITAEYFRIDGHEKYAEAADDVIRARPHKQLFLKLYNFETPTFIVAENEDNADNKLKNIKDLAKKYDHSAWIILFEAALIHHFQPYLNIHFKNTFPSSTHIGYAHLLDIGIDTAQVTIDETKRLYWTKKTDGTYTRMSEFTFSLSSKISHAIAENSVDKSDECSL